MFFTFQESMIWEAGDPVDPNGATKRIKATTKKRAWNKIAETKTSSAGRKWILVKVEPSGVQQE